MTIQPTDIWQSGRGGLRKTELNDPSGAHAEIYQHGAHLTTWRSARGKNWIFTSENAVFDGSTAIRGGVPIIFPQFNAFGSGPRHGFARNLQWQCNQHDGATAKFQLSNNEQTQSWPHPFLAEFTCHISTNNLNMSLNVSNLSNQPFTFTCALHSYFQVENLATTHITGLEGLAYWDNDGSPFSSRQRFEQSKLTVEDAFDRVFFDYQSPLTLHDAGHQLQIEHRGFRDIVVWNPGREAAEKMTDFSAQEYQSMVCIEAAQIDQPIVLEPGQSWLGEQTCIDLA